MKTIRKVEIIPVFVEEIPSVLESNKIYISEKYKTSSHLCLCGCGNLVIVPFHPVLWWKLVVENGKITISPSIGNFNFACKSHYIITKNTANFV